MKVQGATHPGSFSVEQIPGTNLSLIRLFQNVTSIQTDDFTGFEYDEYHVKVQTWDGVVQNVEDNYDVFLEQGIRNDPDYSQQVLKSMVDTI